MAGEGQKLVKDSLEEEPKLPLTPMIDVVFQLLIFFMFTMRFSGGEGWLESQLPTNRGLGYEGTPPITLQEVRIKLLWALRGNWGVLLREPSQDPDGNKGMTVLKVSKTYFMKPNGRPDWDRLLAALKRAKAKYRPSKEYPTLPVIIEGYKMVEFQNVVSALNTAIKAGITEITFAAPEKPF